jgi:hypothetical protein
MKHLWQGSGEQLWQVGEVSEPAEYEGVYTLTLDLVWTDHDDVRRLQFPDHYRKLELHGGKEELERLAPLLVDMLNANRLPSQMRRQDAETVDG